MAGNTAPNAVIDVAEVIERQPPGRFLYGLVALCWVVTFFDGYDSNVIAYAAPYLSAQYGLDRVMMGNVFSIGLLGTLIGGFAFGYLGDRVGRRPGIILATGAFGVLTIAFLLAGGYVSLLALRLLDGIAVGGMLPLAWALNIEYAPRRLRATVVTVIMVGYSLGTALGGPISLWLTPRFGWQSVFVFGGVLSLLSAGALLLLLPESARFLASKGQRPAEVARLLGRLTGRPLPDNARFIVADEAGQAKDFTPALLFRGRLAAITPLLWVAYIFSSMTAFFLATWTPLVFEALHYSRSDAALAGTLNSLAGAVGGLLLMRFTDTKGSIAITAMPLVAVPLLLVLAFVDMGEVAFMALFVVTALFIIGGHFGLHSIAGIFYPSAYRGNGAGWATSVAKIGSIAGPAVAGWILATNLPVRNIFAVLAICPAVFVVCIAIVGVLHMTVLRREEMSTALSAAPGD